MNSTPIPPHIQTAASRFITMSASRSNATANNYKYAINLFLQNCNGSVDSVSIASFLQTLHKRNLQPSSRATYISAIRAFLLFLMNEEIIPKNPINLLRRPKVNRSKVHYLQEKEALTLIPCANPQDLALLALLLGLGLRVSEVTKARWRDLYEEQGLFGLLIPNGKGGASRIAVVPQAILEQLQANRRFRGQSDQLDSSDKSFILEHEGLPYTRQRIWQIIRNLGIKAGLTKKIGPHTLRHSFATIAARSGVQPYDLQESLGHQKLETTMFYVHIVASLKNPTSAVVANALFPNNVFLSKLEGGQLVK